MAFEIPYQNNTALFTTTLKDETGSAIARSALQSLTLTFKNKKTAQSSLIRMGDQNTDYIDAGSDASLKITGDITIEARIKLEDPLFPDPLQNYEIFNNETTDNGFVFRVDSIAGKLMYRTKQVGVNQFSRTVQGLTKGIWQHIFVERSGVNANFYLGDTLLEKELSASHIDPIASTGSHLLLKALDGFADFIKIYNRLLTADEKKARVYDDKDIQLGLISDWRFDGNARDSKGANHGKLFGTETLKNWGIINGRYEQDVKDVGAGAVNNHTMGATDGLLSWNMQAADNPIFDSELPQGDIEEHIAEYTWVLTSGSKTGKHIVDINIRRRLP